MSQWDRKHSTTMQTRIVSRLWFCRRPWRFKIKIRRNIVHFRKSYICSHKLDVQETDFSFSHFYRSWDHFSRCRFTDGREYRLTLWDLVIEVFHSVPNRTDGPKREPWWNPLASTPTSLQQTLITFHQIQRILVLVLCCMSIRTTMLYSKWLSKVAVPQWGTCPELTEFLWIGCLTGLIWTPKSKYVTLTPNINSQNHWQRSKVTHDERNNLLHLFSIICFSSTRCTKNFSLRSCCTMAKRIQYQKEKRKSCVQVATSSDEYIFFYFDKFFHWIVYDCISKSGDVDSFGETRQQDECWTKLIRRSIDVSMATQGCILWWVDGKAAGEPVASRRRRRLRRLRQSLGWDSALQKETSFGWTRCP